VNQALRVLVWIWIHQNRIHDAKNRRGRADAQRERQNGGESEAWVFGNLAEGEAEVLQELMHKSIKANDQ
jgi:hypothetical protein